MSDDYDDTTARIVIRALVGFAIAALFWLLALVHPFYIHIGRPQPAPSPTTSPYACQVMACTGPTSPVWKGEPHATP